MMSELVQASLCMDKDPNINATLLQLFLLAAALQFDVVPFISGLFQTHTAVVQFSYL